MNGGVASRWKQVQSTPALALAAAFPSGQRTPQNKSTTFMPCQRPSNNNAAFSEMGGDVMTKPLRTGNRGTSNQEHQQEHKRFFHLTTSG